MVKVESAFRNFAFSDELSLEDLVKVFVAVESSFSSCSIPATISCTDESRFNLTQFAHISVPSWQSVPGVGVAVGITVGTSVGFDVGEGLGVRVGELVGVGVLVALGLGVGVDVGL